MQIEHRPIGWFKPHPDNYREHPSEQVEQIAASLRRHGQVANVVARPDGTLVGGHGVVEAARSLGWAELAVFVSDGSEADARHLLVALNELARQAQDSDEALASLLIAIQAESSLEGTGFDDAALRELLGGSAQPFDPDSVEFPEYDENIDTSGIKTATCPECGHEFPV